MNKFHLFFILISINLSKLGKKEKKSNIFFVAKEVDEGKYNIILQERNLILIYNDSLRTLEKNIGFPLLEFEITFADKEKKYCYIRHVQSGFYVGVKKYEKMTSIGKIDKEELQIEVIDKIIKDENSSCLNYQWEFLKEKESSFIIRNKLGCILNEVRNLFFCLFDDKRTFFNLVRIYQIKEKNMTEEEKKILDDEPIDVFIKYIDLNDPNLIMNNLSHIEKDKENEELKYCIRSILINIPWIRKIFILMPNEKVKFLKNYSEINEKIIYVHDKDILGHESANSMAFQYRIWKLKKFGLSENFISMDDDYFIGKPIEKSDFFYVENYTVYPLIINTDFGLQTEKLTKVKMQNILKKLEKNRRNQTSDEFEYRVYRTYLFLIQYFNYPVIVPYFTHNAIPVKCSDLKELFDLIDNSKDFKYPTLYALYRNTKSLQYQTSLVIYSFNKYKRKVNKISHNYIDAADAITGNFDFNLFCINTGGNKDYSEFSFMKMKITMEKLFPSPSKYEINESKSLAEKAFNIIKKINLELEKCKKEYNMNVKKMNELEKANETYHLLNEIKRELDIINNVNFINKKKIKEYKTVKVKSLDIIKERKYIKKQVYFLLYFQLVLLIIKIKKKKISLTVGFN